MSIVDVSSKGANFKFSISLLKESKYTGKTESVELDPGVLSYIEIEDNILEAGLTGAISIDNKYKLLDKVSSVINDNIYIDINILDTDSKSTKLGNKMISFLSLVDNTSTLSENIQNSRTIYKIEEAVTSLLKKSTLYSIDLLDKDSADKIVGHMKKIIGRWQESTFKQGSGNIIGEFADTPETGDLISYNIDTDDSLYDILYRMADSVVVNGKLPIIKIKSTENAGRLLTLKELFTNDHTDFLNGYLSNRLDTKKDYSNVYLEPFSISPLTPKPGTPSTNIIEDYQLIESDIELARNKFWGDYELDNTGDDITKTNIELLDFTSIVDSFESDDLQIENGPFSNIPLLQPSEKKLFRVSRDNNNGIDGIQTLRNSINNKVKKSFLCLGESIVLDVPGKIYRTPGKFITINGDGSRFDNQVWFVTSIKHIFNGLDYTNQITAARLTGNEYKYAFMYSSLFSLFVSSRETVVDVVGDVIENVSDVVSDVVNTIKKLPTIVTDFFGKK